MRAALLHGFGDLRVDDVPDPTPAPDECVLRVLRVQPSVTEAMLTHGEPITLHERLVAGLRRGPIAFGGHEFCAEVLAGPGDGGPCPPPGTRVTAVETVACSRCVDCSQGEACVRPEYVGFTRPGAFAELLAVPARNVVAVPEEVSDAAVTATQPLVGALHAHTVADIRPGESVLVLGAGVMGLHAVQLARRGNAGLVAVTGRSPAKRELAGLLGADVVLEAEQADDPSTVADLTAGRGFDVVLETAGGAPSAGLAGSTTVGTAARAVRREGRVVMVSVLDEDAHLPLTTLREKAVSLLHPPSGRRHARGGDQFAHALRLLARGDVEVEAMITHVLDGLDRLPEAVAMTLDKRSVGAINPPQVRVDLEVTA